MTRPYHRVPTKTYKMSVKLTTKEELNYRMTLELIFNSCDDFMKHYSNIDSATYSESGKVESKKIIVVYNLLKKLWDANEEDDLRNFLKMFLLTHRSQLIKIVVIGTLSINFDATLENVEAQGYSEGKYLAYCDQLKFIHDMHEICKVAGIKE